MSRKNRLATSFILVLIIIISLFVFGACNTNYDNNNNSNDSDNTNNNEDNSKIDFLQIINKVVGYECDIDSLPMCFTLGEDGSYCNIDTNPYDLDNFTYPDSLDKIKSMNKELGLPDYVYQEMISTSYSQGKQTYNGDEIAVTWYYHPDKGLDVTYKII